MTRRISRRYYGGFDACMHAPCTCDFRPGGGREGHEREGEEDGEMHIKTMAASTPHTNTRGTPSCLLLIRTFACLLDLGGWVPNVCVGCVCEGWWSGVGMDGNEDEDEWEGREKEIGDDIATFSLQRK
jgi:hypothetical protein